MKLNLILLFLIAVTIPLKSQNTIAFVDTSSVWYGYFYKWDAGFWIYNEHFYFYSISGDTAINDTQYQKLYYHQPYYNKLYYGAIREENRKVYFRFEPNNSCDLCWHDDYDTLEILLYDFSINVGDTINHNSQYYSVITEIDSILLLDGKYRKRFYTGYDIYWIEGIGSTLELFWPIIVFGEWECELTCFENNGEIIYSSPYYSACFTNNTDYKYTDAYIYPNPFRDKLYIKTHEDLKYINIKIFNILGQIVFSNGYSSSEIIIGKNLKNGIYSIYIETEKYTTAKKVIKIN
jgi:hypothetical protein